MNDSKVFILYADLAEKIGKMPREEKGALLEAILCYLNGAALPDDMPFSAELAFNFLRPSIDHGAEKSKTRSKAAAKRWEKNAESETQTDATDMQSDANECKTMQTDANGCKADANGCSIKNKKQEIKNKKQETRNKKQEINQEYFETPNGVSCTEPVPGFMPEPQEPEPPEITLPLNDGTEHPVTQSDVLEWCGLYPAVDVRQELRNMRGWLLSNPTRRKTARGINAFVVSWLQKEQNRGGSAGSTGRPATRRAASFADIYESLKGGGVNVV